MQEHIFDRMREVEDRHWWFAGRRKIVNHVLSGLELPPSPRILEVGCGTGGNLKLLSAFGDVTAVDCDEGALTTARARSVGQVVKGSLPDGLPFATERFDLIVLLDVLEHVDDDGASLSTLHRLVAPGGYLLITVPAFMFLWGRHDVEHHHKRRYVEDDLRRRVEQARLAVEHSTYFNSLLFPVAVAVRLLDRLLPSRPGGADLALPSGVANRALEAIFSVERHFVTRGHAPFGVSLLVIARKARG